jgi:flavin reductase (DIM6/NTAB) family NADH-FMN oxidoreductase RutF
VSDVTEVGGTIEVGSEGMDAAHAAAQAMSSRADAPLFVVTVASGEQRSGCLVGFVTQCSIHPARYLVCVSKANHTWGVVRQVQSLALHLLGHDQHDLARVFGGETGDTTDKFAGISWIRGVTGSPVLTECAAWLEGIIEDRWDVGDHVACLVDPVRGGPGTHSGQLSLADVPDIEPGHPA